ncbi:hypothetical protein [Luteibacter sp.]|uniref:hypothetical protein n=1 Tax=Luteibacter sp. TaxID=1886636 RepID=UPI003F8073AD
MLRKESFAGRSVRAFTAIFLFLALAAGSSVTFAASSGKPSDPLACDASLIDTVAEALHVDEPDSNLSTCRRDPTSPDQWIVAMFIPVSAGAGHEDESPYDLNLVIWNAKTAQPVASFKQAKAIEVNAPIRGSASIDTARYNLADGVRAFGLRNDLYTSCGGCSYSETKLALYVRDGKALRRVLATQVNLTDDGIKMNACANALRIVKTTIQPAATTTKGWHDLTLSTTTTYEDESGKACDAPMTAVLTVPYDGKSYGEAVNEAVYKD